MAVKIQVDAGYTLIRTDRSVFDEDEAKSCVDQLKAIAETRPLVVFDFGNVKEVSSAALRTLTRTVSTFAQTESRVTLVSTKEVARLFKDQGLDRLFEWHATLGELISPSDPTGARQRALEFLNTTLEAVAYTLQVSANTQATAGKSHVRDKGAHPPADIAATVGLISAPFTGALIIGFPNKTYLGIMSRLLGQEYTSMSPEIQDGAAELLNIILGQVKISLNQKGFAIKQAIPTVIQGEKITVLPASSKPSVIVPYSTDVGEFYIELTTNPEGAK